MFGCFRAAEVNDPEVYVATVTAILARYPEAIAARVCDRATGLPATTKWQPAPAEVREACEKLMAPSREAERRESERRRTAEILRANVDVPHERRKALAAAARREFPLPVREGQNWPPVWGPDDERAAAESLKGVKLSAEAREKMGIGVERPVWKDTEPSTDLRQVGS